MIPVTEQINAVSNAPIPFFFAVLAISIAIWGAFEWAYRAMYNKARNLSELERSEAVLKAEAASRKEAEFSETMKKLIDEIDTLKKEAPSEVRLLIEKVSSTSSIANNQLNELGRANTAVTEVLRRGYRGTDVGTQPSGPLTTRQP
jgi:hypothetical protein